MSHAEAIMRYATAKDYIQACKMVVASEPYKDTSFGSALLPLHMLGAFALELYLKAWLLKSGSKSKEVKKYGHNLDNLYGDAKAKGLPEIGGLEQMKDHFSGPHSDFTYRYINPGDIIERTNWNVAFKIFFALDYEVDSFIGASASHGLLPGH